MPTLLELKQSIRDKLGTLFRSESVLVATDETAPVDIEPESERIAVLERLAAWGYSCGDTRAIKELVQRGLATYEEAEMPDGQYGRITEAGRAYWEEQNANLS